MMEKVTDLFKAFRNNEIAYDELFGALTRMLSEDPHFATHAIATLDNAQQLTPIPVTDFIQLRSQLENTAETFQQQETLQPETGVNAGDATRMFDAEEQTQRPDSGMAGAYDPTLIANPADFEKPPAATPPADTGAGTSTDQPDDATVIMPTPPRQQSATPSTTPPPTTPPPANPVSPTPAPPELDDQATLIASPAAPESSPVPRAPAAPEPEPVPTPRPTQKDKIVPVPVLAGLGVLGLAIVLALAFWPGE
ncbi:MAG: hypothetical protein R3208_00815, partial [Ketobacteraceae bacterium]|nr:hypothetical protein [Ketobacteraceae bacterium]